MDLQSTDESEDGDRTPPYGRQPQQEEDDDTEQELQEQGADDDDDGDRLRPPPGAQSVPDELSALLVNIAAQLTVEFEETVNSWLPKGWWEKDAARVYAGRRALRPAGPLPSASLDLLNELQPQAFVDSGFVSKYLQTNLELGRVLLANLFGLELHDLLLERFVKAAAADARRKQAGASRSSVKRARPTPHQTSRVPPPADSDSESVEPVD